MWIQKLQAGVQALGFAPNGRTLYTVDATGWVLAWDTGTHEKRRLFQLAREKSERYNVRAIYTVDEGRFLVVQVMDYLRVWDVAAEQLLADSPAGLIRGTAKPAPHGPLIHFLTPSGHNAIDSYDPSTGQPGFMITHPDHSLGDFDLARDGRTLVVTATGEIEAMNLDTGERTPVPRPRHAGALAVWRLRWASGGLAVAFLHFDAVTAWDRASGRLRDWCISCVRPWQVFAISPVAPVFAAIHPERGLTLFDLNLGEAIRSLDFAVGPSTVQCIAFSPDGLTCAVGGSNKQFAVFDVDV